jgi:hypothetical protein
MTGVPGVRLQLAIKVWSDKNSKGFQNSVNDLPSGKNNGGCCGSDESVAIK